MKEQAREEKSNAGAEEPKNSVGANAGEMTESHAVRGGQHNVPAPPSADEVRLESKENGERIESVPEPATRVPIATAGFPGSYVLGPEHAINYLAREAARHVHQEIQKSEVRWRWILTIVAAFFAFVGYATLANLVTGAVKEKLETKFDELQETERTRIDQQLTTELARIDSELTKKLPELVLSTVGELRAEYQTEIAFLTFARLVQELQQAKEGFTNEKRDAVMERLRTAAGAPKVRARAEFALVLEQVIDVFNAASLDSYIDEIDELAGAEAAKSIGMVVTLVEHYGTRLVGEPLGQKGWKESTIKRFERYVAAARRLKSPEASLAVELLVEFMKSDRKPSDGLSRLLKEETYWTGEERAAFHARLIKLSRSEHQLRPGKSSPRLDNMADVATAFMEQYRDQLNAQLGDDQAQEARDKLRAIANGLSATSKIFSAAILKAVDETEGIIPEP